MILAAGALKLRYRRSVLGFGWTLAYPALATALFSLIFAPLFPQITGYPVYVVIGVLAWHFFSVSCAQAMDALLGGAAVMRRVYVPSAVFPLAAVAANLANLVLCLLVLPPAVALLGFGGTPRALPLAVGVTGLVGFTAGVALALAALNVFFRDVRYFFDAILLLWFYATPIVYPPEALPGGVGRLLVLNPLCWIVGSLRAGFGASPPPSSAVLVACLGAGLAAAVISWRLYVRLERRFHLYW